MGKIRFRLAKPSDAKQIANVHLHIRDKYDKGFFAQVNYAFLVQYYKVVLNDPCEVVVCAENEEGRVVGFSSGSLDAERKMKNLRKHKLSFVLPLLTSAICNPNLIKNAIDRLKSTKGESDNQYISSKGARLEFWAWLPEVKCSDESVVMQDMLLKTMETLGTEKVYFEVDDTNKNVMRFHKFNGACVTHQFRLPDGRTRFEMYYDLTEYAYSYL